MNGLELDDLAKLREMRQEEITILLYSRLTRLEERQRLADKLRWLVIGTLVTIVLGRAAQILFPDISLP